MVDGVSLLFVRYISAFGNENELDCPGMPRNVKELFFIYEKHLIFD